VSKQEEISALIQFFLSTGRQPSGDNPQFVAEMEAINQKYDPVVTSEQKPVASSGGGAKWWDPGDWFSSAVDVAEDILPSIDDTFADVSNFLEDNTLEVAALVLTGGAGTALGLTAGQTALAATTLTTAAGVDKGQSVPEALLKTVATAGAGEIISGVSDTIAKTVTNNINVSEDMIKLATNTAISTGISGGDFKTFIIATTGSQIYNQASTTISNTLKNTIDLPDIKADKVTNVVGNSLNAYLQGGSVTASAVAGLTDFVTEYTDKIGGAAGLNDDALEIMSAGATTYLAGGDALAAMTTLANTKNVPVVIDALKDMVFPQPAQVTQTTQTTTPTTTTEQQPLIDTAEITQTTLGPVGVDTVYEDVIGGVKSIPIGPEAFAEYPIIGPTQPTVGASVSVEEAKAANYENYTASDYIKDTAKDIVGNLYNIISNRTAGFAEQIDSLVKLQAEVGFSPLLGTSSMALIAKSKQDYEKYVGDNPKYDLAKQFVAPFVKLTSDQADAIKGTMTSAGKKYLEENQPTGDIVFAKSGIKNPITGKSIYLPVGVENFSLGTNPTWAGTGLLISGGLADVIDATLPFLFMGPGNAVGTSILLNTAEAVGSGAEGIEKEIFNRVTNNIDGYRDGEEFQGYLDKANGDLDKAIYLATSDAKGLFLHTSGLVQGVGDAFMGHVIVNPVSKVLKSTVANITSTMGLTGASEFITESAGNTLENLGLQDVGVEIAAGEGSFGAGVSAILESSSASGVGAVTNTIDNLVKADKFTTEIKEQVKKEVESLSFVDNIPITPSDKDILIKTIIGEAAGEGADGQAAVAHVILNRVKDGSYGNSVTDVAKAPYQFSAWNDVEEGGNSLINTSKTSAIYKQVEQVVDDILNGSVPDPTGNATHYWNPKGVKDGKPYWGDKELSKHVNGGVTIGNHIFAGAVNPNADFTL